MTLALASNSMLGSGAETNWAIIFESVILIFLFYRAGVVI